MDASIVREHQSRNLVLGLDVRALLGKCNLDAGWSPVDEVGELLLSDPLEGLVDLGRVNLALDNIQDRHVNSFLGRTRNHDVFRLEQSSHDIENGGLSDRGFLNQG